MHSRQFGAEKEQGIGGGIVSKESQKNLEIAERLCQKGTPNDAVPYLMKAMEDKNNLDAFVQCAFLCPTNAESIECLEAGINNGRAFLKKKFGSNVFEEGSKYAGHFWDFIESRPYMRILQAMVRIAIEGKKYRKAADAAIEMLRLCPGDNLGQRFGLGSLLLRNRRVSEALSFAQQWISDWLREVDITAQGGTKFGKPHSTPLLASEEEKLVKYFSGSLIYTAAYASFKLFGDCPQSRQYLRMAAKINPVILVKILAKIVPPGRLAKIKYSRHRLLMIVISRYRKSQYESKGSEWARGCSRLPLASTGTMDGIRRVGMGR
ncbi:hypothetical protein HWV62_36801 [Athelia sp. TMB]|nr:hypothetical protein HWV62_36801 [Athelia sp. TMB]